MDPSSSPLRRGCCLMNTHYETTAITGLGRGARRGSTITGTAIQRLAAVFPFYRMTLRHPSFSPFDHGWSPKGPLGQPSRYVSGSPRSSIAELQRGRGYRYLISDVIERSKGSFEMDRFDGDDDEIDGGDDRV